MFQGQEKWDRGVHIDETGCVIRTWINVPEHLVRVGFLESAGALTTAKISLPEGVTFVNPGRRSERVYHPLTLSHQGGEAHAKPGIVLRKTPTMYVAEAQTEGIELNDTGHAGGVHRYFFRARLDARGVIRPFAGYNRLRSIPWQTRPIKHPNTEDIWCERRHLDDRFPDIEAHHAVLGDRNIGFAQRLIRARRRPGHPKLSKMGGGS